ncbi:MAG TPA: hypothetical protein VGI81_17475, partial [Tepidisphaeraceae bacterium]
MMRRSSGGARRLVWLLVLGCIASAAPAVRASRYGQTYNSLDLLVRESDLVVRATIIRRDDLTAPNQRGWGWWVRFEADVTETFKGDAVKQRITFLQFRFDSYENSDAIPAGDMLLGLFRADEWKRRWPRPDVSLFLPTEEA